jgi:tetratricopeptide (TPR) repeat protein
MGDTFLVLGQRQRAEEVWGELRDLGKRTGVVTTVIMSMAMDAILATLDGHLEEVVEMGQSILARGEELGLSEFAGVHARLADLRSQLHLGKADDVLQRATPRLALGERALCLAHLGRDAEVAQILERRVLARPDITSATDETPAWYLTLLLEAAVMVGHRRAGEPLLNRLANTSICVTGMFYTTCVARHLGGAAALLERYEEARKYYQEAIKVSTEMRFRPELALTRLQLAELLLEHYPKERAEALEHLDFAIAEFRDMKMQPSLERALRHKEILKA